MVQDQGADHVLDHTSEGYLDELVKLSGGDGPNVILEMLADANLNKDMEVAAKFGRICVIGARGDVEINPRLTMGKELEIYGVAPASRSDAEKIAIHTALGEALKAGTLRPVIGKEFPMSEAVEAHKAVMASGAYGKIVLIP